MDSIGNHKPAQRVRRSIEEWRTINAQFEASGLSVQKFCAEQNLGLSTFSRWRQRLLRADADRQSPVESREALFLELDGASPTDSPSAWEVELELGPGVVLRLRRAPC